MCKFEPTPRPVKRGVKTDYGKDDVTLLDVTNKAKRHFSSPDTSRMASIWNAGVTCPSSALQRYLVLFLGALWCALFVLYSSICP